MYFHIPYPLWAFSSALTVFSWDIKEGLSLTRDAESALIRTSTGTVPSCLPDVNNYTLKRVTLQGICTPWMLFNIE